MALKLVDEGAQDIAKIVYGATAKPTTFTLRLFTDANALADSDTYAAGHTIAAGGGYADITLYPEGGSAPAATVSSVGGILQVAWPQQTFTFTGALTGNATIKGYQIVKGTTILHTEELTTNFQPTTNGDTYKVTPIIQIGNGTVA